MVEDGPDTRKATRWVHIAAIASIDQRPAAGFGEDVDEKAEVML